jgi:sulfoxide reductase heme-binding subunit YedZ
MRLSGRVIVILLAVVGLVAVVATDQVIPATSEHQAQLRIWLAARAAGVTAYLLLTAQVLLGMILSHPTNQAAWRQSGRIFPWHENAWIFVLAFLGAHIVAIIADPWAGVGIAGAFIPGLSEYRSPAVALGTMGLYALLITGLTARYARRLPAGVWLKVHRVGLIVVALAWLHGVLSGTDSIALLPMYLSTGGLVAAVAAWRYWVVRGASPTTTRSPDRDPQDLLSPPTQRDPGRMVDEPGPTGLPAGGRIRVSDAIPVEVTTR